jgi:uncharacterized membrane protein
MIIYITFIHATEFWLRPEDNWIWGMAWLILDVFATAAFVFTAGISLSLSYHAQQRKINRDPEYQQKQAHINFAVRTLWIAGVAFFTHLLDFMLNGFNPRRLWFWEVFQAIAMARIACYFFLKFDPKYKVMIGLFIIIVTDPLKWLLIEYVPVLAYILAEPPVWNTPFPFFGFAFIGCAMGDWINSWNQNKTESKEPPVIIRPKNLLIIGLSLIGIGILTGLQMIETTGHLYSENVSMLLYQINRFQEASWMWPVDALPGFLVRSSMAWSFYAIGSNLIILVIFLWRDIIRLEKDKTTKTVTTKNPSKFISMFGSWSLTIYHVQFIAFIVLLKFLPVWLFPIVFIIYLLILYGFMSLWTDSRYGRSYGTFEWFIKQSANYVVSLSMKRSNKERVT